ncbi:MAG: hypothetical protein V1778_01490 [bacterium]
MMRYVLEGLFSMKGGVHLGVQASKRKRKLEARRRWKRRGGRVAQLIGRAREERVYEAFTDTLDLPAWFRSIRHSSPREDRQGIDFVLDTSMGRQLLQVKGSAVRALRFRRKRSIPVIVVCPTDSQRVIRQKVKEALAL